MGFFPEFELSTTIYNGTYDSNTTAINYPSTATFTRDWHIIRLAAEDRIMINEQVIDHEANPDGDQTDVKVNAKIVQGGNTYTVVEEPYYLRNLNKTKFRLSLKTNG